MYAAASKANTVMINLFRLDHTSKHRWVGIMRSDCSKESKRLDMDQSLCTVCDWHRPAEWGSLSLGLESSQNRDVCEATGGSREGVWSMPAASAAALPQRSVCQLATYTHLSLQPPEPWILAWHPSMACSSHRHTRPMTSDRVGMLSQQWRHCWASTGCCVIEQEAWWCPAGRPAS